jgi:hypothetical protein
VIHCIIIIINNEGLIFTTQSHYVEKVLKMFNHFNCKRKLPFDASMKLYSSTWGVVDQLEYAWVIACLMYVMICTRPDIVFVVVKTNRYTSNLSHIIGML